MCFLFWEEVSPWGQVTLGLYYSLLTQTHAAIGIYAQCTN